MALHLSQLWLYPIKSCRGISVSTWPCDHAGWIDDRAWMVVDQDGKMIAQRQKRCLGTGAGGLNSRSVADQCAGQEPLSLPRRPDMVAESASALLVSYLRCRRLWSICSRVFYELITAASSLSEASGTRPSDDNPLGLSGETRLSDGFPLIINF